MLQRSWRAFWRKMNVPTAIVFIMASLAGVAVANFVSAVLDREPPIDYIDARAEAPSAPAGGTIDIHFDVYRYRICPVIKTARLLTDAQNVQHAVSNYTVSSNTRPGRESYDRTITIPEAAAVGLAFYQIRITYACNYIHNLGWPIEVVSPQVFFRVTPSETEGLSLPPLLQTPDN